MGMFGKIFGKVKSIGKKIGPKFLLSKAKNIALGFVPGGGLLKEGLEWFGEKRDTFNNTELGGHLRDELRKERNTGKNTITTSKGDSAQTVQRQRTYLRIYK